MKQIDMNQTELAQLHDEARTELLKIPGVVGVGYGFKWTAGKLTDIVGFPPQLFPAFGLPPTL